VVLSGLHLIYCDNKIIYDFRYLIVLDNLFEFECYFAMSIKIGKKTNKLIIINKKKKKMGA
jgi:hypothetical protein